VNKGGCLDQACRDQAGTALWILAGLVFGGLLLVMIVVTIRDARRNSLLRNGVAAQAVIAGLDPRGPIRDAARVKVDVELTVTAADGTQFRAWTVHLFPITALPQVGWSVPVRYAARDSQRVVLAGVPAP
jgi:hypothetical protein